MSKDFLFTPVPHDEAIDFIRSKPAMASRMFRELLPELRARAFTISGIEHHDTLQRVRDMIAEIPAGGDWAEQKKEIIAEISPFLVTSTDPDERGREILGAERRAELLLRTHGFQAYSASAYRTMDAQRDVLPYWKYQSMGDQKVRATHAALDGKILPADSKFWNSHFPPWEWGCRCQVVPMTEDEVAEVRAAEAKQPLEKRNVIEDEALRKIEEQGELVLGPNEIYDLRTQRQRGNAAGYEWDPGDLTISLDELRKRYDAEVWEKFQTWAKATGIPETRHTVWQWLGGSMRRPGDWPPSVDALKTVKGLGGSTGAKLVEDPETGEQFVLELGNSPDHLREEVLADQLYQTLGVPVPEAKLYETPQGPTKLARFVKGRTLQEFLSKADPAAREAAFAQLREFFVVDALLGNWDVAGLGYDNILVDSNGMPWRIDNGGSLRFRAQGKRKTDAEWTDTVRELKSLRDPNTNSQTARIFAGLTDADIDRQISKIMEKRDEVLAIVPHELRDRLAARLDDLELRLAPKGEISEKFAQEVKQSRVLGRTHFGDFDGIEDHAILFWQERDATGQLVTRAKLRFTQEGQRSIEATIGDEIRAAKPAASSGPQPLSVDSFWAPIQAALKTVNHHATDGQYNQTTLDTYKAAAAQLAAFQPKTADEKAMKKSYDDVVAAIETAINSKSQTPKFSQYHAQPAPAKAVPASDIKVEVTDLVYTSKNRQRGNASDAGGSVKNVSGAWRITSGDVEITVAPWARGTSYAHRGTTTVKIRGEATPERIQSAIDLIKRIGVDARPTPAETTELVYLKKGFEFAKPEGDWRAILTKSISDAEKVTELKAWAKANKLGALIEAPTYQPEGRGNTWGDGWKTWDRWDLPAEKIRGELPGYTLFHNASSSLPGFVESILDGGGQVTNTMERLRVGVPITSGMSTGADQETGGANYFFTRITPPELVAGRKGLFFKIDRLARADAFSFPSDYFGDVRPAGENTHTSDPHKSRGRTIANYKSFGKKSSNETIFKNGLQLLDDIDFIKAGNEKERQLILEVFARHGITALPDGRQINDIVK